MLIDIYLGKSTMPDVVDIHSRSEVRQFEPVRTCELLDKDCELCCSICGARYSYSCEVNYCMNCGAKVVHHG